MNATFIATYENNGNLQSITATWNVKKVLCIVNIHSTACRYHENMQANLYY